SVHQSGALYTRRRLTGHPGRTAQAPHALGLYKHGHHGRWHRAAVLARAHMRAPGAPQLEHELAHWQSRARLRGAEFAQLTRARAHLVLWHLESQVAREPAPLALSQLEQYIYREGDH